MSRFPSFRGWVAVNWEKNTIFLMNTLYHFVLSLWEIFLWESSDQHKSTLVTLTIPRRSPASRAETADWEGANFTGVFFLDEKRPYNLLPRIICPPSVHRPMLLFQKHEWSLVARQESMPFVPFLRSSRHSRASLIFRDKKGSRLSNANTMFAVQREIVFGFISVTFKVHHTSA